MLTRQRPELSVAFAIAALAVVLAFEAPGYFSRANLTDVFLANLPILIVALGMTLVVITGEIDISVGSIFAICSVAAGVLAKAGVPLAFVALSACFTGLALGSMNGILVGYARIPSIVVTLATMVALRDSLRWITQGGWVQNLPAGFQWLALSQSTYPLAAAGLGLALVLLFAWALRFMPGCRAIYATGSNVDSARLAGLDTAFVKLCVFALTGALTGLGALLSAARFTQIPSNTGLGLELKVIAAVVVGGTAIGGGRGSIAGTCLGGILLGAIGPALTFLGASAYWERALQGAIILTAVTIDAFRGGVLVGVRRAAVIRA